MAALYLSFDLQDAALAQALAQALKARGIESDLSSAARLQPDYRDRIKDIIQRHRATVIVWSRTAVANDDCIEEASLAFARGVLFAVRIDSARTPSVFAGAPPIDMRDWTGDAAHPAIATLAAQIVAKISPAEASTPSAAPAPAAAAPAQPWPKQAGAAAARPAAPSAPKAAPEPAAPVAPESGGPPDLNDDATVKVTLISAARLRRPQPAPPPAADEDDADDAEFIDRPRRGAWIWGGSAAALALAVVGFAAFRSIGAGPAMPLRSESAQASAPTLPGLPTAPRTVFADAAASPEAVAAEAAAPDVADPEPDPAPAAAAPPPLRAAPVRIAAASAAATAAPAARPAPPRAARARPATAAPASATQAATVVEVAAVTQSAPPREPNLAAPTGGYDLAALEPVVRMRVERARQAAARAAEQALLARSPAAGASAWVAQVGGGEYAGDWANGSANGCGVVRLTSGER